MNNKILLIEDNLNDEKLMMMALREAKITNDIMVARDGEEALDYLFCLGKYNGRNRADLPQLVLLDLKLPKIDGLEVLKEIRANPVTKLIPVVILTSSREESDIMAGYDHGTNSFVVKPMDPVDFAKAIERVGLYWLIVNTSSI
jgi:CheY-like chemotaxis protein